MFFEYNTDEEFADRKYWNCVTMGVADFKVFAKSCARFFLEDFSIDSIDDGGEDYENCNFDIPREIEPDPALLQRIESKEKEVKSWRKKSDKAVKDHKMLCMQEFAEDDFFDDVEADGESAFDTISKSVDSWTPDNPNMAALKSFMLGELENGIAKTSGSNRAGDELNIYKELRRDPSISTEDWRQFMIRLEEKNLEDLNEAISDTNMANNWLKDFWQMMDNYDKE